MKVRLLSVSQRVRKGTDLRNGWYPAAGDAYSLCEDLTMEEVEEWIATHLESQPANEARNGFEPVRADGTATANEPSTGSPTLSAAEMVKREASLSASPLLSQTAVLPMADEELKPILPVTKSGSVDPPSSTAAPAVGSTALGRLVVRNLPPAVTLVQLKDVIGSAMLGYTLAVSIPQDQATATVEVTTLEAAHEAAARLHGHAIEEGGARRILQTEVVVSVPPPPPAVTKSVPAPAGLASLPSSPPEPRFREDSISSLAPRGSACGVENDSSRREGPSKRPRSGSPGRARDWDPSRYRRTPSPSRYDSRSPVRKSTSPYRTKPLKPKPLFWYYAVYIPASVSERRLTDDLLEVNVTVHDIIVEPVQNRNDRTPSRTAAIAFGSAAEGKRAVYYFTCHPYEGRTVSLKEYRDPRTGAKVPRWDGRVPYVNHRYNLAHPPAFPYARVAIRNGNPARSEERELRTLLISKVSGREIDSLYIESKPAPSSSVVHLQLRNRAAAVDLIKGFDGFVADGHALSVNWDDPDWRMPPPPPRRWSESRCAEHRLEHGALTLAA